MSRILVPSAGPDNWRQFLAQPDLHWARGYSARTLAYSWELSGGIPAEVEALVVSAVGPVQPLLIIPERKTALPGGSRESQSDVFLVARHGSGVITCTIEGKVDEPFGPTVAQQMLDASPGKVERLDYLLEMLGLQECPPDVHYQLLHRTVSALVEADRFDCEDAAMIVHSFSPERRWFEAYAKFVELLGGRAGADDISEVSAPSGKRLFLGWACGDQQYREM